MKRSIIPRISKKAGLPPGALVFTGEKKTENIRIQTFLYDTDTYKETEMATIPGDIFSPPASQVYWMNITGLHETQTIETIGNQYKIHPLVLEDILHTEQRPKLEDLDSAIFLVVKMVAVLPETLTLQWEQVSLIIQENRVFSFQEYPRDVFDPIRKRIRENRGRIRKCGADYLVYALLDAIIDEYYVALEMLGERLEELEDRVISDPDPEISRQIYHLKREMIILRRSVWPLRDVTVALERTESRLFQEDTTPFLRDLYDHTIQAIETIETYRDVLNGLRDTYLSSISNRMNTVMQVLTIIATIFIPLTFIAGIYGMNFEWMPELKWKWAYPAIWLLMGTIATGMMIYFKRKKWI
ncbi:magnesium/cobalt transporter CorA [bacterium]|nr:magnesium/cobalt transporter CorA [bacterium]